MKNLTLRMLTGMVLLAGSITGMAATMDITATFSPSMDNPEKNTFTNTTPQSGFCATWSNYCAADMFSINTNLSLTSNSPTISVSDSDSRDHIYFKLPPKKAIALTNELGGKGEVSFSYTNISARMWYVPTPGSGWGSTGFQTPSGGCAYANIALANTSWYAWVWRVSNPSSPTACYKKRTASDVNISSSYMTEISVGYTLETPSPLQMDSGIYTGSVTYTVGPGKEIDFGNKWDASDTFLTVNFTLSVNHELKLTTTAGDQKVSLQPCASGRTCTEDEGSANWERWMITRITPELTGRSQFSLSSSGAFTVYLQCEQQNGSDCALKSDNTPSQQVPVQTLLTLPDNIVDIATGAVISKRPLRAGKDLTKNNFVTKTFGENKKGSIDFLVSQRDVDTMLKTRPDTYRGAVTVIFDPKIY